MSYLVPPTGIEPAPLAPEANALSAELRGHIAVTIADSRGYLKPHHYLEAKTDFPNIG